MWAERIRKQNHHVSQTVYKIMCFISPAGLSLLLKAQWLFDKTRNRLDDIILREYKMIEKKEKKKNPWTLLASLTGF